MSLLAAEQHCPMSLRFNQNPIFINKHYNYMYYCEICLGKQQNDSSISRVLKN
jgi:hypothetical protein